MKNKLLILSGLLLTTVNISRLVTTNYQDTGTQLKEWHLKPEEHVKSLGPGEWGYFAIDNINLSQLNIKSIDDLHSYQKIEIPNLKIIYGDKIVILNDIWNPKFRQLESEDWKPMFYQTFNNVLQISLESAATLWYSNSGDLMMRLAYRAAIKTTITTGVHFGGFITFKHGSLIKIY